MMWLRLPSSTLVAALLLTVLVSKVAAEPRLVADLVAAASPKTAGRRDMAALASVSVGASFRSPRWAVQLAAGLPVPPGLARTGGRYGDCAQWRLPGRAVVARGANLVGCQHPRQAEVDLTLDELGKTEHFIFAQTHALHQEASRLDTKLVACPQ